MADIWSHSSEQASPGPPYLLLLEQQVSLPSRIPWYQSGGWESWSLLDLMCWDGRQVASECGGWSICLTWPRCPTVLREGLHDHHHQAAVGP